MPKLVRSAVEWMVDSLLRIEFSYRLASVLSLFAALTGSHAFAQGAAVFAPMSKVEFDVSQSISFRIFNRLDKPLKFSVHQFCDIDRKEQEGKACEAYFRLRAFGADVTDSISVAPGKALDATVQLTTKVDDYALFKYRFEPEVAGEEIKSGINFVFDYQPGFLFLATNKYETLVQPDFSTTTTENARVANFNFVTSGLSSPKLVSVSAKIIHRNTKTLKRFIRLAGEKIVDPSRGELRLAAEFAPASDNDPVCFEMFVTHHGPSSSVQKIEGCEQ